MDDTSADGMIWVESYTTQQGKTVSRHQRRITRAATTDTGDHLQQPPHGHLAVQDGLQATVGHHLTQSRGENLSQSQTASDAEAPGQPVEDAGRCAMCGQYAGDDHRCPSRPAGMPEASYHGMPGEDRVQAMLADLDTSVQAIVESGQLQAWLDVMASNGMHRWSANNRLLAIMQLSQRGDLLEEPHLMGFRQWADHDRKVTKGAKAVWILAPVKRRFIRTDDNGEETQHQVVVGFKGVAVFNVSDTEGKPLAKPPVMAVDGEATPGTLEGLQQRVGRAGYSYSEDHIPGCRPATGEGTLGFTDPSTKRIVVDARLSPAMKASTLAHELGHVHCGHVDAAAGEYQRHRGRMETEAEMTAYLVNRSRGMHKTQVDAFSPGYIASWSEGDPSVMRASMDTAVKAYNTIMDGAWPE